MTARISMCSAGRIQRVAGLWRARGSGRANTMRPCCGGRGGVRIVCSVRPAVGHRSALNCRRYSATRESWPAWCGGCTRNGCARIRSGSRNRLQPCGIGGWRECWHGADWRNRGHRPPRSLCERSRTPDCANPCRGLRMSTSRLVSAIPPTMHGACPNCTKKLNRYAGPLGSPQILSAAGHP